MDVTAVLFDLDGTLLPMDQEKFTRGYLGMLCGKLAPRGYRPEEVVDGIWAGVGAMVANQGQTSNEDAFWREFYRRFGEDARADRPLVDEFYAREFRDAAQFCGHNPQAAQAVRAMKADGATVALATNPIFPAAATRVRIGWTGLAPEEFALYTTYENCHWCKPSLGYYREVLDALGLRPEQCLMVGNDVREDMVAQELGMKVFLLTDCLINRDGADIDAWPHGGFPELLAYWGQLRGQGAPGDK